MPVVKGKAMKKKPLVSAIIAAYNEEEHLPFCINALLRQSYDRFEIIVVENGESSDRTFEIAKGYAKKNKNLRAYSMPGKQKGPGNAWNFGIKKAKGDIIMIVGADLLYGKNYVKEGIKPILRGESVGIVHNEERCGNYRNLWARAFFYKRKSVNEKGLSRVFSLVRKDYVSKRLFNPDLGYADDQTIYRTEGAEFPGFDLDVGHLNPSTFEDTWEHTRWVGKTLENKKAILLALPIFPAYSLFKTVKHLKEDFYPPFLLFLPFYYSVRYFAYLKEILNSD